MGLWSNIKKFFGNIFDGDDDKKKQSNNQREITRNFQTRTYNSISNAANAAKRAGEQAANTRSRLGGNNNQNKYQEFYNNQKKKSEEREEQKKSSNLKREENKYQSKYANRAKENKEAEDIIKYTFATSQDKKNVTQNQKKLKETQAKKEKQAEERRKLYQSDKWKKNQGKQIEENKKIDELAKYTFVTNGEREAVKNHETHPVVNAVVRWANAQSSNLNRTGNVLLDRWDKGPISAKSQTLGLSIYDKDREKQMKENEERIKKADERIKKTTEEIEEFKEGQSTVGKFFTDVAVAGTELGLDLAAGKFTRTGMLPMFSRAAGQSAASAEDEGADRLSAWKYGIASGGLEALTEKMFVAVKPLNKVFGKGFTDELAQKAVNKLASKMTKEGSQKAVYHGGRMLAAAFGEGLEEMVSEGLDPSVANAIYADAIGQHKTVNPRDVLYSGLIGGTMGGLLGTGNVISENYSFNQNRESNQDNLDDIIKFAKDTDENSLAYKNAEAMRKVREAGEDVSNIQIEITKQELARDMEAQEKEYDNVINAANEVVRMNSFTSPVVEDNGYIVGLADNTERTYNDTFMAASEAAGKTFDNDLDIEDVSNAVASIRTGTGTVKDTDFFMPQNTENRKVYEEVTGEKLPSGNVATRQYLIEKMGQNFIQSAQAETEYRNDMVKGEILQNEMQNLDAAGQDIFIRGLESVVDGHDAEYASLFRHYYRGGRAGGLTFETVANMNPAYNDSFPESLKRDAFNAGQFDSGYLTNRSAENSSGKSSGGRVISTGRKVKPSDYKFYQRVAQATGIDIEVTDNEGMRERLGQMSLDDNGTPNGFYDVANNRIIVNYEGDRAIDYIVSHELTHYMQDNAPEEYKALKEFLRKAWKEADIDSYNTSIARKIQDYEKQGVKLSEEEALDEILADSTYEMVQNEDILRAICQENRTLAQKILDALKKILDMFRGMRTDFSPKYNKDLLNNLGVLEDTIAMWENGIKVAAENTAVVNTNAKPKFLVREGFVEELMDWYNNTPESKRRGTGGMIVIGKTADVLKPLGISDYNFIFEKSKIQKILDKHNEMSIDVISEIPNLLEDPILIMQSQTVKDSIVVLGELLANNGKPVMAAINLKPKSKKGEIMDFAVITSAYTRNKLQNFVNNSDMLYINPDKKRTDNWSLTLGLQLPSVYTSYGYIGKVTYYDDVVNKTKSDDGSTAMSRAFEKAQKKFSMQEPVEESGNLIALHNIGADKLRKAFDLGGFPMPSIAITKDSIGHTNFGEISLLFDKGTIDPEVSGNNVYGADAWTPVFPQIEYKLNEEKADEVERRAYAAGNLPFFNPVGLAETNLISKVKDTNGNSLIEHYKNHYGMKQMYLSETSEPVQMISRTKEKFGDYKKKKYSDIIEKIGKDRILSESVDSLLNDIMEADNFDYSKLNTLRQNSRVIHIYKELQEYAQNENATETIPDGEATEKAIDEKVNQAEYEEWLRDLFDGIVESEGIHNGKDPYTRSGDRRSFEELHYPVTLQNIVRAMQNNDARNDSAFFNGIKTIRATATPEFNSIDDIRAGSDRLSNIDTAEYEELYNELSGRLSDTIRSIVDRNLGQYDNSFIVSDNVGQIIGQELADGNNTADGLYEALNGYRYKTTHEEAESLANIAAEVSVMPVHMFEAKPERAVEFDEVQAAIVPNDIDSDIVNSLEARGIDTVEYEAGNDEDRINKVNETADRKAVKFSLKETDDAENKLTADIKEFHRKIRAGGYDTDEEYEAARLKLFRDANDILDSEEVIERDIESMSVSELETHIEDLSGVQMDIRDIYNDRLHFNFTDGEAMQHGFFYNPGIAEKEGHPTNAEMTARDMIVFEKLRRVTEERERAIDMLVEKEHLAEDVENNIEDIYNSDDTTQFHNMPSYGKKALRAKAVRQKSYEELQNEIQRLREEFKVTDGKMPDKEDIRRKVRMLVSETLGQNLKKGKKTNLALTEVITDQIYEAAKDAKSGQYESIGDICMEAARELAYEIDFTPNHVLFEYYMGLNEYLRQTPIRLTERDKANITDYNYLRRRMFGKVKLVNADHYTSGNIENVYMEMHELFPELISGEAEVTDDMLKEIIEVRENFSNIDDVITDEEFEQVVKDLAGDLLDITFGAKTRVTRADRWQQKYDKLKSDMQKALADANAKFRQQKKEIRNEERAWYREKRAETVKKEREKAEKKLEKYKEKQKQSKENQKERKERRDTFNRIEKTVNWLGERTRKPTDNKHLPEGFRQPMAEFLASLDLQTIRSEERQKKEGKSQKKVQMDKLRIAYEQIAKEDGSGDITYDSYVFDLIKAAEIKVGGKPIDYMTTEQLKELDTILTSIKTGIQNINRFFNNSIKESVEEKGESVINDNSELKPHKELGEILSVLDSLINESNVTPGDFFELLGGGMNDLYKEMRRGFDTHIEHMRTIREFFYELTKGNENRSFRGRLKPGSELEKLRNTSQMQTFDLEGGGQISLNPAQIMSLYCLNKREQAQKHIYGSGIIASPVTTAGKLKRWLKQGKTVQPKTLQVSPRDVIKIISTLTADQKKIADKMMNFMSTTCAKWGNEASMALHGIKKFTEKNYFPIRVWNMALDSDFSRKNENERIKNLSFTKSTVENANNPILIDDIFEVVADHVNKMSLYGSLAVPMADFQKVYNYKRRKEDGTIGDTVKGSLLATYGEKALRYINNFMTDLNNNTNMREQEGGVRIYSKLLANYKKSVIGMNLRVLVQQPTAIVRAFTFISPKYFVGITNPRKNLREMKKYCPIAFWKSLGYSQTDVARDIDDIMMNREWSKFDLITMRPYGFADNVTWSFIWAAVKKEVAAKHKDMDVNSEEFLKLCGERASQVYDKTQVVDSPFHRSQIMRNKNQVAKTMTSFMAEPTRTFNMVRTELILARRMWIAGDKKGATAKANRALSVYLLNAAFVSAMAAIVDMIRDKYPDEEDKGKEGFELWLANFFNNLDDNANPLNQMALISNIWKLKDGFGTSDMALEGFDKVIKNIASWWKYATGDSDKSALELTRGSFEAAGMIFGIPGKNIMRELETILGDKVFAAEPGKEQTNAEKAAAEYEYKETFFDKIASFFGGGKSEVEKQEKAFNDRAEEVQNEIEGLSGEEKEDKLWSVTTENYTKVIEEGDYATIKNMRSILEKYGSSDTVKKFDKQVEKYTLSNFKKTIGTGKDDTIWRDYMIQNLGYDDAKISEVVCKSDTAKSMQENFALGNDDAGVADMASLIVSGASKEDLYVLYTKRSDSIKASDYAEGEYTAPVEGEISSSFGYRNIGRGEEFHKGVDIAVPANTSVKAMNGGKVTQEGWSKARGFYIKISHGNDIYTLYQHLNEYNFKKGDIVHAGDQIGLSGSTGDSTGPHLHVEMTVDGEYVDPTMFW